MTTYRLLGNSGLRVHPLCLGTMLFGEAWKSRGQSCAFDEAEKILMRYLELGGNFIDTSNFYQDGESEETVGKILKKNNIPRHRYVLASKFSMPVLDGPNGGGNSKKNIVQSIDATLKRLQVDYLDIYYVHFWDFTVDIEQLMRWLDDTVIKTGKALHIALSDAPAWQGAVANTLARTFGWSPFVAYQGKYSLLDRSFDQEVLPMARKMSMGVIPWGVTGENKLVGTSSHAPDEREKKIADKVAEIAKELNCMPVQVCYAWVINRPGIACALVGPGTLVALENMMKSIDVTLSEEHMKALTEVSETPLLFPYSLIGTDTDSCQSLYGAKRTFSINKRQ